MTTTPTFPQAFATVQRKPEEPIAYRWGQRTSDAWAGWRDRRVVVVEDDATASSPWLQRLGFECATSLEGERRAAQATFAVLDAGITDARQSIVNTNGRLEELRAQHSELRAVQLSDAPVTAVDHTDAGDARLARRQRERGARLGELALQEKQWEGVIDGARQSIQSLVAARSWHWSILLTRSAHLIAFFNRRAATYTRAATRKASGPVLAPRVPQPDWLDAAEAPAIVAPFEF